MPKKDTKPTPKAPSSEDEDPKSPPKSTGAIPKSHSYAGSQEKEGRGRKRAAAMSEDESEPVAGAIGGTRDSSKPEEGTTRRGLFARMRSKSKSKSPTKREKSKSKSPSKDKGKRTKSPSPVRSLFGRKKNKSPAKRDPDVQEEQGEEENSSGDEQRAERPSTIKELRNIMGSSSRMTLRSLTVRPGPDTEPLVESPPDSSPLVSRADLYKANLGERPAQGTFIEAKGPKESPVEEDLTNTSSVSVSSLVQGVQLDDDSRSLQSEGSGGKSEEASGEKDPKKKGESSGEKDPKKKWEASGEKDPKKKKTSPGKKK